MKPFTETSQKIVKIFAETPTVFTIGPFVTTTNRKVGVYLDMRKVYSNPKQLKIITQEIIQFIKEKKIKFDFIFGGASAGIPIATSVALSMNKPFGFVRKEPKKGGTCLACEGNYKPGMTVILIDDALGQGDTKKKFVKNIRKAGLKIDWVIVVMSRSNRHWKYLKWTRKAKVKFQSFGDIFNITDYAQKHNILTKEAAQLLRWFGSDAEAWFKDTKKWKYFLEYKRKKKHKSKSGV